MTDPIQIQNYLAFLLLDLYPELINMTKHKDSDARNVVVKVKLLESDANPEAEGLPLVFGRSHSKNLSREWFSSVAYHGKGEREIERHERHDQMVFSVSFVRQRHRTERQTDKELNRRQRRRGEIDNTHSLSLQSAKRTTWTR